MATQPICPSWIDTKAAETDAAFFDFSDYFFDMAPVVLKNRSEAASGERIYAVFAKEDGPIDVRRAMSIAPGDAVPATVPAGMKGLVIKSGDGSPELEVIVGSTGA